MNDLLKYWPLAVVAAGAIASGSVDTFRINAHAEELSDISDSVDENEDAIEVIQRLLIQRQGDVALQVQQIEQEQEVQGRALDRLEAAQTEILRLLREPTR